MKSTIKLLRANGWDDLDANDPADAEFIERIEAALATGDRDEIAAVIFGGGTLGDALETADALLADA